MDESARKNESMHARIQQLEQERDELHKDIEQLCMQKAGPDFISLATQTYFRRTAGLEQEIENLKTKLAGCIKENSNIRDELSQAQRIKTHLDQLHKLEVSKNAVVVKQLEHFRRVAAEAFEDRDQALMEAEKTKENEDLMRQKLNDTEIRLQELSVGSVETEQQLTILRMKLENQQQEIENCRKVINKFYVIRQHACRQGMDDESRLGDLENASWDEKCSCLYDDPTESWSFNVHLKSSSTYDVAALLEEVEKLRGSVDNLQNTLHMGLEMEKHLKSKISIMEQNKVLSDRHIIDGISSLRECHNQQKIHIMELLADERSFQHLVVSSISQKIGQFHTDVQAAEVASSSIPIFPQVADFSESLAVALKEKVSALILMSQQEERHIWERNVHAAVQETVNELESYLKLASEGKVKALLELAELKQQYQQLLEKTIYERSQGNVAVNPGERSVAGAGRNGKLKKLLRKASLGGWLGTVTDGNAPPAVHPNWELEGFPKDQRLDHSMDNARLQIEYDSLKDSIHSLERLTLDVRKLRLSLIQVKITRSLKGSSTSTSKLLEETIREAESLKSALSNALPLSWSVEGDVSSSSYVMVDENLKHEVEKIDPVSVAGLEMVDLLIMAAHIMKEKKSKREPKIK